MSFLSSFLFWLLTITGNVQPCDNSDQEACYESTQNNSVFYSPFIIDDEGANKISNGF